MSAGECPAPAQAALTLHPLQAPPPQTQTLWGPAQASPGASGPPLPPAPSTQSAGMPATALTTALAQGPRRSAPALPPPPRPGWLRCAGSRPKERAQEGMTPPASSGRKRIWWGVGRRDLPTPAPGPGPKQRRGGWSGAPAQALRPVRLPSRVSPCSARCGSGSAAAPAAVECVHTRGQSPSLHPGQPQSHPAADHRRGVVRDLQASQQGLEHGAYTAWPSPAPGSPPGRLR